MEYIREININEAVIHVLDSNGDEPLLNEFGLELSDEIYSFLLKHISKCLKDEELRYAVFKEGKNAVKEISQEYLNGHNNILNVSKELGRQLFALMKSKGNIPSCDLITVSISTEYGPMLAILKMDYIKNYMHTVDFIDNKVGINIMPQHTGLPLTGSKIQKCAFIKPIRTSNEFDLMVIDKSSSKKANEEYGSNYFLDNYLICNIIDNERDITKRFLETTEKWTRVNLSENADKAEKIRTAVKKKLSDEDSINVEEFAEELFNGHEEVKTNFINFAKENNVNERVKIDKEWVDKKLKRVRLKIDNDIDLYLNHEAYHNSDKFQVRPNGDGSIDIVLKHIRNYIEK